MRGAELVARLAQRIGWLGRHGFALRRPLPRNVTSGQCNKRLT